MEADSRKLAFENKLSTKSSYSREEVEDIILTKDAEIDQLLNEFYEARVV